VQPYKLGDKNKLSKKIIVKKSQHTDKWRKGKFNNPHKSCHTKNINIPKERWHAPAPYVMKNRSVGAKNVV